MRLATGIATLIMFSAAGTVTANSVPQSLPFSQNWTNTGLLVATNNWSGVPGITGWLGDDPASATNGILATTVVADFSGAASVSVNQTITSIANGGVFEFHIANPVVAIQGITTADYPHIIINVITLGLQNIQYACNLRDLDESSDNAVTQIAIQYRVGIAGVWTNVPGGYFSDVTTGPSLATLVTPVLVTLPAGANNQAQVQIRVLTTRNVTNEMVGIDDILVTGESLPVAVAPATWGAIKSGVTSINR